MPEESSQSRGRSSQRSLAEQLITRTLDPLGVVMLTRERIHDTLEDAVARGRVTRSDANDLATELLRRGRVQTEELLAEVERWLESGRGRLESAGAPITEYLALLARMTERARRGMTGGDASGPAASEADGDDRARGDDREAGSDRPAASHRSAESHRSTESDRSTGSERRAASDRSGGGKRPTGESRPPIAGYDDLTAREVQARLRDLSPAQLRNVQEYERRHANRKTVLAAVDRALD